MDNTDPNQDQEKAKAEREGQFNEANQQYQSRVEKADESLFQQCRNMLDKYPAVKAGVLLAAEVLPTGVGTLTVADFIVLLEAAHDTSKGEYKKALARATIALVPGPVSELDPLIDMLPDQEKPITNNQQPQQ